ncbi:uncharacterized protein EI97DRAFT_14583 [Westerdykella ornata]|uniref:Uncharacterized protein n=1 Tax=Westerdykella ornata TaxID=318751 RepID=A0A6A6JYL4_WESOR|nr:uncharacterized protein EI97DRAFT_14583 [Westerdykella ornata]KAF2280938.1 hypothetical protein EI97DRAFT_14583 [Westerdykella ornata]
MILPSHSSIVKPRESNMYPPISSSWSFSPAASSSSCAIFAWICFCCSDGSVTFFALPFFAVDAGAGAGVGAMAAALDIGTAGCESSLYGDCDSNVVRWFESDDSGPQSRISSQRGASDPWDLEHLLSIP